MPKILLISIIVQCLCVFASMNYSHKVISSVPHTSTLIYSFVLCVPFYWLIADELYDKHSIYVRFLKLDY